MNSHVKEVASDAATQIINNPKAQGAISAGLTIMGGYNLIEAATSILSILSIIVGICVGLYAIACSRRTLDKLNKEIAIADMRAVIEAVELAKAKKQQQQDESQ